MSFRPLNGICSLAIALLLGVVAAGAYSYASGHRAGQLIGSASTSDERGDESAHSEGVIVPPVAPRDTAGEVGARLVEKNEKHLADSMKSESDLRVFVEAALQQPQQGGIAYARFAIATCRVAFNSLDDKMSLDDLPYDGKEDSNAFLRRNHAFHKIKRACAGFAPGELGASREIQLMERARSEQDPVQKVEDQVAFAMRAEDRQLKDEALKSVVESRDPLLIQDALKRLLMTRTATGLAYRYDGQEIPVMQADVLVAALDALPCAMGLLCDARTPEVFLLCLNRGACYENRIEALEAGLPEGKVEEFRTLLNSLLSEVNSGSVKKFH